MPCALALPDDPEPGAASPAARHRALEDQATADFLAGDYRPAWPTAARTQPTRPDPLQTTPSASSPPVAVAGYRVLRSAYGIVLYASPAGRVGTVICPFADGLSAEQYAIAFRFPSYDVVPATVVIRATQ
jgi:hypothetical protein